MIELEKDPAAHGLGISLSGNKDDTRARMSIYVAHIEPKGPAGLDGRIMVGDELLEVGETSNWQDLDEHLRGIFYAMAGSCSSRVAMLEIKKIV